MEWLKFIMMENLYYVDVYVPRTGILPERFYRKIRELPPNKKLVLSLNVIGAKLHGLTEKELIKLDVNKLDSILICLYKEYNEKTNGYIRAPTLDEKIEESDENEDYIRSIQPYPTKTEIFWHLKCDHIYTMINRGLVNATWTPQKLFEQLVRDRGDYKQLYLSIRNS